MFRRQGQQCVADVIEEALPGHGATLVGALGDAAKEREHCVDDATQDRDDQSGSWLRLDPGMAILLECYIEGLMVDLDSPVTTYHEHPLLRRYAVGGEARNEVAVVRGEAIAFLVELLSFDAEDRQQVRPPFGRLGGGADIEASHDGLAAYGVLGLGVGVLVASNAKPVLRRAVRVGWVPFRPKR